MARDRIFYIQDLRTYHEPIALAEPVLDLLVELARVGDAKTVHPPAWYSWTLTKRKSQVAAATIQVRNAFGSW